MSDDGKKNVVRISDEAFKAVKRYSESRGLSVGEAATILILRGESRRLALDKYAERRGAGRTPTKAKKVRAKKAKAARRAKKAEAKSPKTRARSKAEAQPNGGVEEPLFSVES